MSKLSLSATAIGSLPHDSAQEAHELIWEYFEDFPFWPQLSNVSSLEDMVIQFTQNIPGMVVKESEQIFYFDPESDEFYTELEEFYTDFDEIIVEKNLSKLEKYGITSTYTSAIESFYKDLNKVKPHFAKGQITGPFTWGTSICDKDKKCIFYDETYRDIVVKALALKAIWQVNLMKKANLDIMPIIFMDEPSMGQLGTSAFLTVQADELISCLKEVSGYIQEHGGVTGIHCCGKADWDTVLECNINLVNFDAYSFTKSFTIYSEQIKKFLNKGGIIAWGIVPTLDVNALKEATSESLVEKFEESIDSLAKKGIDKNLILKQSILTPSCGAGALTPELAAKAMKLTKEVSEQLKVKYGDI